MEIGELYTEYNRRYTRKNLISRILPFLCKPESPISWEEFERAILELEKEGLVEIIE